MHIALSHGLALFPRYCRGNAITPKRETARFDAASWTSFCPCDSFNLKNAYVLYKAEQPYFSTHKPSLGAASGRSAACCMASTCCSARVEGAAAAANDSCASTTRNEERRSTNEYDNFKFLRLQYTWAPLGVNVEPRFGYLWA